jgi:hypothetical protein
VTCKPQRRVCTNWQVACSCRRPFPLCTQHAHAVCTVQLLGSSSEALRFPPLFKAMAQQNPQLPTGSAVLPACGAPHGIPELLLLHDCRPGRLLHLLELDSLLLRRNPERASRPPTPPLAVGCEAAVCCHLVGPAGKAPQRNLPSSSCTGNGSVGSRAAAAAAATAAAAVPCSHVINQLPLDLASPCKRVPARPEAHH